MSTDLEIIGRQSSHYTRMVRMFAIELGIEFDFVPILDLLSADPDTFAGNPALKLPIVRIGGESVFGSINACRALHRRSSSRHPVFWPEDAGTAHLLNAHEVLAHAMATQVEVVFHEIVEKRPSDATSRKRRLSLENCLAWLDAELPAIRSGGPQGSLSLFELGLFCLLTHIPFRNPMDLSGFQALQGFAAEFGSRASAVATPYRFDAPT